MAKIVAKPQPRSSQVRPERAGSARWPRLALWLGTALLALAGAAAAEPVDFADHVAERNLAPAGPSLAGFPSAADRINRFNGALGYPISLGPRYPVGGRLSYQIRLRYTSSIWSFHTDATGLAASPDARFNAGLGWELGMGRLLAPTSASNPGNFWTYADSDGQRTRFYATLHEGETSIPGVFYSRDSSYLRLQISGSTAILEFPDGTFDEFTLQGSDWRLTSRQDRFGNRLDIAYGPSLWTFTDSHGREHRVYFTADPSGHYPTVIDRVELAAFGGTVATYTFTYDVHTASRPVQDTSKDTAAQVSVPLLSGLTLPEGESFAFTYAREGNPEDGRLESLRIPTGGTLEYGYREIALPYLDGAEHAADVVGVERREVLGLDGASIGAWTFDWSLDLPRVAGSLDQPRELTVTETYPDGHRREHKFSVYVSGDATNAEGTESFQRFDYGLPFTRNGVQGVDHPSRFVYDAGGKKLRTHLVRYQRDACNGCFDVNPRRKRQRTIYHDDADSEVTSRRSDFDGLGTFRTTERWDSLGSAPKRITTVTLSGGKPDQRDPWILGLVTERNTREPGDAGRTVELCTDPATGLLLRERIRAGSAQESQDLLRTFEYDARGNQTVTRYYGGEVQPLASGELCSLPLPGPEQYARFSEVAYGTRSRGGWLAADGSVFLETYSATIDPNTGRVASSHDGDELVWTYDYDRLGRRIATVPPPGHGGARTITYSPAQNAGTGRAVPASRHTVTRAVDGTVVRETKKHFGALGETLRDESRTPDGWAGTSFSYDAQGRKLTTTSADGRTIRYLDHDPFGRIGTIRPPDGSSHDRSFTYRGNRVRTETVPIGKIWDETTQSVIEVDRSTTVTRDFLGRLVAKTVEDEDGATRTETHTRNLEGEIVATTITDGTTTHTSTHPDRTDFRDFLVLDDDGEPLGPYDALGHRTEVDHGYGTLVLTFDRAGRLVDRKEPDGTLWTRNLYATSNAPGDSRKGKLQERLRINRDVPHVPDGRVEVRERYVYGGDGGGLSEVRTRALAGNGGSMPLFRFISRIEQDASGATSSVHYPVCDLTYVAPDGHCDPTVARTVHYHSDLGRLTGVTATVDGNPESWIDSITYDPAGFVTERILGNGFVETRSSHASGGGRVGRMTITHPQSGDLYDSGTAVYDGRGRLVQLGDQRRISDRAYSLELPEAPPDDGGAVIPRSHTGERDVFGNTTRRLYQIPSRPGVASADGYEAVWEIFVYAPGHRLLWKRVFNDYEAWNFNRSDDIWYLTGVDGRRLRARVGFSKYQGTLEATYTDAELTSVWLIPTIDDNVDRVYLGSRLLGTSDARFTPTRQEVFHYDLRGRLFAISNGEGQVTEVDAPLP